MSDFVVFSACTVVVDIRRVNGFEVSTDVESRTGWCRGWVNCACCLIFCNDLLCVMFVNFICVT